MTGYDGSHGTWGSSGSSGSSGSYADGDTTADVPLEGRKIYQEGGNYLQRMRCRLI
jgi:hypothetical protein